MQAYLDHVAVAFERRSDAWARYGGDLPGKFLGGGVGYGFANYQIEYANGMRVEVLEPAEVERNDFLRRFLDRSGPGLHHLTFKVDDIHEAIAGVTALGLTPINISTESEWWKEMFIHPKEVPGIVVQIAEAHGDGWTIEPPDGFPTPRTAGAASLTRVVLNVPDPPHTARLFRDLLGGRPDQDDLVWDGHGRLRLSTTEPTHLEFATERPEDLTATGDIEPVDNAGVRLRLTSL